MLQFSGYNFHTVRLCVRALCGLQLFRRVWPTSTRIPLNMPVSLSCTSPPSFRESLTN